MIFQRGGHREVADGADGSAAFADDASDIVRVQPDAKLVTVTVQIMQNTGPIGMIDELGDDVFDEFLNGERCFHNDSGGNGKPDSTLESFVTPSKNDGDLTAQTRAGRIQEAAAPLRAFLMRLLTVSVG